MNIIVLINILCLKVEYTNLCIESDGLRSSRQNFPPCMAKYTADIQQTTREF